MKIEKIEIENFRSIQDRIYINEKDSVVSFVGPNNVGKSNILRAINLFFNGEIEPGQRFDAAHDLCKHNKKPATIQLTLLFSKAEDKQIAKFIDNKYPGEFRDYRVPIMLRHYSTGSGSFIFTNAKNQKKAMSDLLEKVKIYVDCVYIPAIKDYKTIINAQMMRKIVSATFQGFAKGISVSTNLGAHKQDFQKVLGSLQKVLDGSGDYVSKIISSAIPKITRFNFSLPYDNLEEFLGRLDFKIKEEGLSQTVALAGEGSGIQSFTIYTMLRLLYELRPRNTYRGAEFIWLIEEPETFMHHDLQRRTFENLQEYAKDGHIFISTHSPVFIDKSNFRNSYLVSKPKGTILEEITTKTALKVIGGSLGVSFEDFFMFNRYNVLVEGDTDETLLVGLNKLFMKAGATDLLNLGDTAFIPCGGSNSIPHFYGMYNAFNKYASFRALFDRDPEAQRNREVLVKKGVDAGYLLLVPESAYKTDGAIEDIVDKAIWDKCLHKLDEEGLVELKMKQGAVTGYTFLQKDRVAVKKGFTELLLQHAAKDLSKFEKYQTLLQAIKKSFAGMSN